METKDVVNKIKELAALSETVYNHFKAEGDVSKMIKWDIDALVAEKTSLLQDIEMIKNAIKERQAEASKIIVAAQAESDRIIALAGTKNAEAAVLLRSVKQFVTDLERQRYLKLKEGVPA